LQAAGYEVDVELRPPRTLRRSARDQRKPDLHAHGVAWYDVVVTTPTSSSALRFPDPVSFLNSKARVKQSKYSDIAAKSGLPIRALAISSYGGLHTDVVSLLSRVASDILADPPFTHESLLSFDDTLHRLISDLSFVLLRANADLLRATARNMI
jgi:hypothetical protein